MRTIAISLVATLLAASGQAEWFERGKTAYMTPDGRWRSAAVSVEEDSVEVFTRRDRVLVAKFETGELERGISRRRRSKPGLAFGLSWGAGMALAVAVAKSDEGEVVVMDDGLYVREVEVDKAATAGLAAIGAGIAVVIALTKAKLPYIEIRDGAQSIRLRVGRSDRGRFEHALSQFVASD